VIEIHVPLDKSSNVLLVDDELASELADRWFKRLRTKNWSERLSALADLLEHLQETLGSMSRVGEIFPEVVAGIIHKLGDPKVDCLEQAHIYASSQDRLHRESAGDWFRRHASPKPASEREG
jgi:hypothetical protein